MRQQGEQTKIVLRNIPIRCVVGVPKAERARAQWILLTVAVWYDAARAAASDDIQDALDYSALRSRLITFVEGTRFYLLEALAAAVAAHVLQDERVLRARVAVAKPDVFGPGQGVEVEVEGAAGG